MTPRVTDEPGPEAFAFAHRFTELHERLEGEERERACQALMLDRIFQPVQPGDRFAGRVRYPLVGLSPEPGGFGYYARFDELPDDLREHWAGRTTQAKVRAAQPAWVREALPTDDWTGTLAAGVPLYRIGGVQLDHPRLLREGAPAQLRPVLERYASVEGEIGQSCTALLKGAPQTFHQAVQLLWLTSVAAGTWNYGRLDVSLAPYVDDVTDEEGVALLRGLWRLMCAYDNQYNNRVMVGGVGRPDPERADRVGRWAIEATRAERQNQPQLSLRFHRDEPGELYELGLEAIAEGRTYPILYDDATFVPAVQEAFGVSREVAEQALPYGCGETMIWGKSISSPNGVVNLPQCLLLALRREGLASFDDVWEAYDGEVRRVMDALGAFQAIEYGAAWDDCGFSFLKGLIDDPPILTSAVETYGNTNAADALTAIRRCVFRDEAFDLNRLVEALDADFEGFEDVRQALTSAPKYGNDVDEADEMAIRVHEHACERAREAGDRAGVQQLVVVINNHANSVLGALTPATPDGRKARDSFANANNPAPGMDRSGTTAFLNSLTKLRHDIHAGTVQNMKFSRGLFADRDRVTALLGVFWKRGGGQAMITVLDKNDLEAAMREPEKWGHLMVRVGGFSARFVDLPKRVQLEVLRRTLHE